LDISALSATAEISSVLFIFFIPPIFYYSPANAENFKRSGSQETVFKIRKDLSKFPESVCPDAGGAFRGRGNGLSGIPGRPFPHMDRRESATAP
jgi:hypothetical protein